MSRRIVWAMVVTGVVFFGGVIGSEKIKAQVQYTPVTELDDQKDQQGPKAEGQKGGGSREGEFQRTPEDPEMLAELKEINAQLKQLKALLKSGDVRVTVVMNPKEE
jgi:hypothetical protein